MKKIIQFNSIALIFVLLLLSGCTGGNSTTTQVPTEKDLNTGGKGLELKLLSNMPPGEVWENKPFQIGFDVTNKEIVNINSALVSITSCLSAPIEGVFPFTLQTLSGKNKFNPEGETSRVYSFPMSATKIDNECIITVEICYDSETRADIDVCIDPDTYNLKKNKVCQIKPMNVPAQAAPVVVTKIEEDIIPLQDSMNVRFKIFIDNVGPGQVTSVSSYPKICGAGNFVEADLNKVDIQAKLSNTLILCEPQTLTLLDSAELKASNYFVCETNIDRNKEAYTSPLTINLRYGYVSTQYKTIKIKSFQ